MMSEQNPTEPDASEEQAVDTAKAADAESIRERLPEDIRAALTKRAFSPGAVKALLRDTYYIGPLAIGTGGWIGMYGDGQPGTGLRRPDGALYNFPRSWRYAALERALNLGLITHVTGRSFVTTERGAAVLKLIDRCDECGTERVPGVRSTYYQGNPNSEGHMESHDLITYCPECGATGYGQAGDSVISSVSEYDRDEDRVETVTDILADIPEARSYGVDRPVSDDAAFSEPDVDPDATEDLLDEVVENQRAPRAREVFSAMDEGLYGRPVVSIPGEGPLYRFAGTNQSIAVSRTDTEGDIHITLDEDDRLKVGMTYEIAVEMNVKDMLHYDSEDAEWTGDYWTVAADYLGRAVSKLTLGFREPKTASASAYFPDGDEDPTGEETYYTVTVTEDAMEAVSAPMVGVDADGDLI